MKTHNKNNIILFQIISCTTRKHVKKETGVSVNVLCGTEEDRSARGMGVRHRLRDNTLPINLKGIIYQQYNINTKVKGIYI